MNFNQVTLAGRLTRDVELRTTKSGTSVCDIGLAVNERVKKGEQWEDKSNFFEVVLWGRTAEVAAEYLSKGSTVLIAGTLSQETWEQDGQKRSKVKVIGRSMQMGSKAGGGGGGGARNEHDQTSIHEKSEQQQAPPSNDDIPF